MNLEDIILKYVHVRPHSNKEGWYQTLCKVCNDHGKKGYRAGFKFDHGSVAYNCFNCGITASYHPNQSLSEKMTTVLQAFDVPEYELNALILDSIGKQTNSGYTAKHQAIIPEPVNIPDFFYPLIDDKDDDWCQESIDYLTKRQIDWTTQPFFCVKQSANPAYKKWYGRLIIPVYYNNQIVFYQGRDLTDLHIRKYLSPNISKQNILYGYHNINNNTNEPLYITEGWFDAVLLDGIALFGNRITPAQTEWLNKTKRPKVIIPDKYGNGHLLGEQAIKQSWSIATPNFGNAKDVNEAVIKYGLLYVLQSIKDNIHEGTLASIHLNIYCEK